MNYSLGVFGSVCDRFSGHATVIVLIVDSFPTATPEKWTYKVFLPFGSTNPDLPQYGHVSIRICPNLVPARKFV